MKKVGVIVYLFCFCSHWWAAVPTNNATAQSDSLHTEDQPVVFLCNKSWENNV